MEELLRGIWRSYQIFHFSGRIETNSESSYLQISMDQEGQCTILHTSNKRAAVTYKPGQWHIEKIKNQRYLFLEKKQAYEIITIEPANLVLSKIVTGEKIFMAPPDQWRKKLQLVQSSTKPSQVQHRSMDIAQGSQQATK
jgi:hypothetical protein